MHSEEIKTKINLFTSTPNPTQATLSFISRSARVPLRLLLKPYTNQTSMVTAGKNLMGSKGAKNNLLKTFLKYLWSIITKHFKSTIHCLDKLTVNVHESLLNIPSVIGLITMKQSQMLSNEFMSHEFTLKSSKCLHSFNNNNIICIMNQSTAPSKKTKQLRHQLIPCIFKPDIYIH